MMALETMQIDSVDDGDEETESYDILAEHAEELVYKVWGGDWCKECRKELYNEGKRTSSFDADRPEYTALLDHIEGGSINVVIVPNLSRLSRDREERLRLLLDLDAIGVQLHSVELDRAVDLDDDWELVQQSIQATADDVEKRKEIERSKRTTQERIDNGYDHGRPPFGLTYDEDGHYWIPDRDSGEYQTALTCIQLREDGRSWREIATETDVSKDTVRRIHDRRERYLLTHEK